MPIKDWLDGLSPMETANALLRLNRQSLNGPRPLSFFQSRLEAIRGCIPAEVWQNVQIHLEQFRPRQISRRK